MHALATTVARSTGRALVGVRQAQAAAAAAHTYKPCNSKYLQQLSVPRCSCRHASSSTQRRQRRGGGAGRRKSGLQLQVLSFYRTALRAAAQQPAPESRHAATQYIKSEFRRLVGAQNVTHWGWLRWPAHHVVSRYIPHPQQAASIPKHDVRLIEHQLRIGHRQLKAATQPGSTGFMLASAKH